MGPSSVTTGRTYSKDRALPTIPNMRECPSKYLTLFRRQTIRSPSIRGVRLQIGVSTPHLKAIVFQHAVNPQLEPHEKVSIHRAKLQWAYVFPIPESLTEVLGCLVLSHLENGARSLALLSIVQVLSSVVLVCRPALFPAIFSSF
jgi:hypothetical protein